MVLSNPTYTFFLITQLGGIAHSKRFNAVSASVKQSIYYSLKRMALHKRIN